MPDPAAELSQLPDFYDDPEICTPVVFLDVDGVLNNHHTKARNAHGCIGIDPEIVPRFRRIIHETGAAIVVSSTWRRMPDIMHDLWAGIGLDCKARCIGKTPIVEQPVPGGRLVACPSRANEIVQWLVKAPWVRRICILDDANIEGSLAPWHIQTRMSEGLTDDQAAAAILYLKNQPYHRP